MSEKIIKDISDKNAPKRYNYGMVTPTHDEWKAAFAAAPSCHRTAPAFETLEDGVGSELIEPVIARVAFNHFEDELQLTVETDRIIDDSESDEQA